MTDIFDSFEFDNNFNENPKFFESNLNNIINTNNSSKIKHIEYEKKRRSEINCQLERLREILNLSNNTSKAQTLRIAADTIEQLRYDIEVIKQDIVISKFGLANYYK